MGFKDELKKELNNAINDIDLSVANVWSMTYKEHLIQVKYSIYEETLLIDGIERAKNKRQSIWSHLIPTSKLKATFQDEQGDLQHVTVKFTGLMKLQIKVKVGRETILKDKFKLEIIAPWEKKEKLVPFIEQQVAQYGKVVEHHLPDEQYLYNDELKVTEPGLIDLMEKDEYDPFQVKKLLKALRGQMVERTDKARQTTYEIIISDRIRTYDEAFIASLQESDFDEKILYEEALWLLTHAAHREVIKVALILMSYCPIDETDESLIFTIAHHEEFTKYAILPLLRSQELLWQLVEQLNGWGKVILMGELIPLTFQRKMWFLEQTWDDKAKGDATAILCAEKAEIDILLYEPDIDLQVFTQISRLMQILLTQLDSEFLIEYYQKGSIVLKQYIYHAKKLDDRELFPMIENFTLNCSSWDTDELSAIKDELYIKQK